MFNKMPLEKKGKEKKKEKKKDFTNNEFIKSFFEII